MTIKSITIKSIFVGLSAVGKTSIITRLTDNNFSDDLVITTSAAYINYKFSYLEENNSKETTVSLWDTAG
jgi:GTPase SAR1 family protein